MRRIDVADERRAPSIGPDRSELRPALRAHLWPAALVVLVAFAARVYHAGAESLWIDEAISFGRMRLPLPELIADTIKRKHLPTYFLLLKAWAGLGDSEAMLRFPSAVFGTVSALLTYALGVRLHGRVAGVVAGLMVALAVGQVHYGQEARMYALLCMATTLAIFGLVGLAQRPELAAAWPPFRRAMRGATTRVDLAPAASTSPGHEVALPGASAVRAFPDSAAPAAAGSTAPAREAVLLATSAAPALPTSAEPFSMPEVSTSADAGPALLATSVEPASAGSATGAWVCVFAGTTLALYTHNTAAFFVAALNAAAAAVWLGVPGVRVGFARNWLLCMGCAFVAWAPWLPTLLGQTDDVRENWRGRETTYEWTRDVLRDLYLLGDQSWAGGALALALVALSAYALRKRPRLFFSTLVFALGGALAAYVASQFVPMFYRRLLIWTGPPWFALIGVGIAFLPRVLSAVVGAALLSLLVPGLYGYYERETKPAWRPLIQRLSAETDEHSLILSARAERFLTYYYERHSQPLPRRSYVKVRSTDLEGYVGSASEFFLVGQTQEADFKRIKQRINRSGRYKTVWSQRSQNAILIKYRTRAATPPLK